MIRRCCGCGRILGDTAPYDNNDFTDGYCKPCYYKEVAKIEFSFFIKRVSKLGLFVVTMFNFKN